jgi:hypothetical protein
MILPLENHSDFWLKKLSPKYKTIKSIFFGLIVSGE